MRILLLSNYFPPEIGSGPHLPYELGETLTERGHEVTVVTGFPRYNVTVMPERYRGRLARSERAGGMRILRVNAPNLYGSSALSRGLVQLLAPPVLAARALVSARPDVIYTVTPPIMMGLAAHAVARRHHVPWAVNVQDLFPQCIVDLGMLRSRRLIRLFESMERAVYRKSSAITVMSDGNREFVVQRGASAAKVHVVPNWVDTDAIRPQERQGDFRATHGLGSEFIVLFAGTMGFSQGLGSVIEAARLTQGEPRLMWLMVGGGAERHRLAALAEDLTNVRFLPMQEKEVYPLVLAAADVCLVTLRPEVATPTVPSKIGTIMAAGRPIIAAIPDTGDARQVIEASGAGVLIPPCDPEKLAAAALSLMRDRERCDDMGRRGRVYAEERLSRTACVGQVERVLDGLVRDRSRDRGE